MSTPDSADVLRTMIDLRKEIADIRTERDQLAWSAGTERRHSNDTINGQQTIIHTLSASVTSLQERLTAALVECAQHRADFVKAAEQATAAQVTVRELDAVISEHEKVMLEVTARVNEFSDRLEATPDELERLVGR